MIFFTEHFEQDGKTCFLPSAEFSRVALRPIFGWPSWVEDFKITYRIARQQCGMCYFYALIDFSPQ